MPDVQRRCDRQGDGVGAMGGRIGRAGAIPLWAGAGARRWRQSGRPEHDVGAGGLMRLTEALLQHAGTLRFEDLSPEAVAATRVFAMDSIAVGISGSGPQVPLTQAVRRSAASYGAGNAARVWVTGEALPAASAAMVNGYQIHSQEFDCVHMPAVVHPLAVIQSALFAAAEQRANVDGVAVDGKALITAINVAVDVATLI